MSMSHASNNTSQNTTLHEYFLSIVVDILISKNKPVLTKNEIKNNKSLLNLLQGLTPDILTASDDKIYCFEMYSSNDKESISTKRNRYQPIQFICEFEIVVIGHFGRMFKSIFTENELEYIIKACSMFKTDGVMHKYHNANISPIDYDEKKRVLLEYMMSVHDTIKSIPKF